VTYTQNDEILIEEEQTIVYRAADGHISPVLERQLAAPLAAGEETREWTLTSVK